MKPELLNRENSQERTSPQDSKQRPASRTAWWRYGAGTLAVVVLCVGAVGVAANSALPGEGLYTFKTDVVEEAGLMMRFSPQAELTYRKELYEERLAEVQQLIVTKSFTAEAAEEVQGAMQELVEEAQAMFRADEVDDLTALAAAQDFVSISKAIETLSFKEVDDESHAEFGVIYETTFDIVLDARAELIAENSTSTVEFYVAEQLAELQATLPEATLTPAALQEIQRYLTLTNTAISKGEKNRAVSFVNSATEILDLSQYQTLPLEDVAPLEPEQLEGEG